MSGEHSFLSATVAELSRRKVLRTLGGYAVVVFVLLQLMDAAVDPLRLPDWLPTLIVIVLILGFPVVFMLAWAFELTPRGVNRATPAGLLGRRQSAVLFGSMLLITAALGYGFSIYYAGLFDDDGVPAEQVVEDRSFTAPENSIAVLPFADLSAEGDQAYFSDGMAEEILNLLAQVDGLHVAARTSSFAFRDRQQDVREIGRLLNVRTVLEGSVRTSGNRIRLTAQLINVEDGYHIWSQSYDRQVDDLFAIQDEVASSIAQALVDSFAGLEQRSVGKTDSLAAANAYRTGRLHWWRRSPGELEKAIEFFAEALEQDPGYAPAYAAMADTWLLLSLYGNVTPVRAIEKAQPMIEKALAIDPHSAEAFAALGLARSQIGQEDSAESSLRRAIELNEDYIPAHLWLATSLGDQGRWPEQRRVLEQALALDPLNELLAVNLANNMRTRGDLEGATGLLRNLLDVRPDSTLLLRSLADLEFFTGSLQEGWRLARQASVLEPGNPVDLATLARMWLTLGRPKEADRLVIEGLERTGENFKLMAVRWQVLLASGRVEEAERMVREAIAAAGEEPPESLRGMFDMQLGMLAMAQGHPDQALSHLESAASAIKDNHHDGEALLTLSMAAVAAQRAGEAGRAGEHLQAVESKLARARLNGVDDAMLHYNEAALLAMRNERQLALDELKAAYERGFRELWLLELDWRLDAVRDTPAFASLEARITQDIQDALAGIEEDRVALR